MLRVGFIKSEIRAFLVMGMCLCAFSYSWATDLTLGMSEQEISAIKGKPLNVVAGKSKKIITWADLQITFQDNKAVEIQKRRTNTYSNAANSAGELPPPRIVPTDDAYPWGFELVDVRFDWAKNSLSSGGILLSPKVGFAVKNTGQRAIKYLEAKFVYYSSETKLFDEGSSYIVHSSDTPIEVDYTSKQIFNQTSMGYAPKKWGYGIEGYDTSVIGKARFHVMVYMKTTPDSEWLKYGEFTFEQWRTGV